MKGPKDTMTAWTACVASVLSKRVFKRNNCGCENCPLRWNEDECRKNYYK
jgi:hypothetical protein